VGLFYTAPEPTRTKGVFVSEWTQKTLFRRPVLLKQETVSGSGISSAICKSAPCSRQTTTPAPHHSVFYRPDALPNQQRQGTAGSNCCTTVFLFGPTEVDGKPAGKCYTTGYYAERTYRPTAVIKSVLKRYGVRPSVRPSGRSIARKRQPSASALPYSPRTQSVFGFNNKIFQLGI